MTLSDTGSSLSNTPDIADIADAADAGRQALVRTHWTKAAECRDPVSHLANCCDIGYHFQLGLTGPGRRHPQDHHDTARGGGLWAQPLTPTGRAGVMDAGGREPPTGGLHRKLSSDQFGSSQGFTFEDGGKMRHMSPKS